MKILIASYWGISHVDGINTNIEHLKTGLERQGHQADFLCPTPDGSGFGIYPHNRVFEKEKFIPFISAQSNRYFDDHLPGLDPWIRKSEVERYGFELAALLLDISEYDIIHAQDIVTAYALSRIKPPAMPLVTTIHGCLALEWFRNLKGMGLDTPERGPKHRAYSALIERLGASCARLTITPTRWLQDLMIREFEVHPDRLIVSPSGMDVEAFIRQMAAPTDWTPPQGKKVIICRVSLNAVKGHVLLLQALHSLKAVRQDWVCWMVGGGEAEPELRDMTASLGLSEHVYFLGRRQDAAALMKQADLFVLPSIQDNHPVAVMEAQLAGKLVIVSNAGGIPEMVQHGVTGLVSEAGRSEQLLHHLQLGLDNDSFRLQVGAQAQAWGRAYWSLEAMTGRVLDIYHSAAGMDEEAAHLR
ncbi:glycosyltransferase family 4 protein [Paenibacillus thiaminolyticus]|uniref:glycosyltransferase family 4 protein n=1 Tax=Paenibacillus thiaminolyticus TaxID=49283 RepID=UPI0035A5F38F